MQILSSKYKQIISENNNKNNVNKQINANRINNENEVKTCLKCKQIKQITEFNKDRTKSDGLHWCCKLCESVAKSLYRNNNRQINAIKIFTENDIRTCSTCKKQKLYTEFNKCISDKSGLESFCKDCKANDPKEYFRKQFSKVLNKAIKDENLCCLPFTGCDPHFLKQWFKFQFYDKMNWNNYGSYLYIDHVKPRLLFKIENENDRRIMNHWSNLSPLEKYENIRKSNKYNDEI